MKLSARNIFKGKVVSIRSGPVMASVRVDIGGGNVVTAIVTSDAIEQLGVAEGAVVSVIVKATEVMLGAE